MFVFVLAYLVLTLQERYYKKFKHRELIIVIFLTYMALIVKTNVPVINSVLIMLIALVSVTLGFLKKDKNEKETVKDLNQTYGYICGEASLNYVGIVENIYNCWQYVLHCVNPNKRGISNGINYMLNSVGFEENENSNFEVLGNKWENPELLSEGE